MLEGNRGRLLTGLDQLDLFVFGKLGELLVGLWGLHLGSSIIRNMVNLMGLFFGNLN
jgi:hypothetical protein